MTQASDDSEKILDRASRVGMVILGVSENRNWIELLYEGDLARAKRIELPAGALCTVFVEEIPHKTTVYEPQRTLVYFNEPCDVEVCRDGDNVVVRGKISPGEPAG
jgi:hypothetical protein